MGPHDSSGGTDPEKTLFVISDRLALGVSRYPNGEEESGYKITIQILSETTKETEYIFEVVGKTIDYLRKLLKE